MKIVVVGAGLVGGPIALDLSLDGEFEVTVADRDQPRLEKLAKKQSTLRTHTVDLAAQGVVGSLVSDFDLVVNALPGFLGFRALSEIIQAKKNVVDISFFPEDPFDLDELARNNGVIAIVDCGVAPGLSNMLVGYASQKLTETKKVTIYVGGLPEVRSWPYEYKAGFSPIDVIAEYTRPAKLVENGRLITLPALTDPELVDFPRVGTLEAFNTDGLRTLARTIPAAYLKEKTLRYPGHREKMAMLRESGFFSEQELEIQGMKIRPIDLTAALLFPLWQLKEGERDVTIMRVVIEGLKDGLGRCYRYDLFDCYDPVRGVHSMARTTGYTATSVVRLVKNGMYNRVGISPPEYIGMSAGGLSFVRGCLEKREIRLEETILPVSSHGG